MIVLLCLLLVLTEQLNLQHLFVKITSNLKLSGDIELNPGPHKIIKSVQGSFNKSDVALYGETAGRQCACNALFDYILVEVNQLYKFVLS